MADFELLTTGTADVELITAGTADVGLSNTGAVDAGMTDALMDEIMGWWRDLQRGNGTKRVEKHGSRQKRPAKYRQHPRPNNITLWQKTASIMLLGQASVPSPPCRAYIREGILTHGLHGNYNRDGRPRRTRSSAASQMGDQWTTIRTQATNGCNE